MIRSMLYATDLGLYAPYVMQHALALARTFKADLYVIHVVEPIGLFEIGRASCRERVF